MFSLLITIISVALVAALAMATIHYGGDVVKKSRSKALATTLVTQGQQMLGATELFRVHQGRWPASAEELVEYNYLSEIPIAPKVTAGLAPAVDYSPFTPAYAALPDFMWEQVRASAPQFWLLRLVSEEVCRAVNLSVRGDNGIYNAAMRGLQIQCFGTTENYTVLIHQPGDPDISVTVPVESGTPALEVDDGGGGWSKPPSVAVVTATTMTPTTVTTQAGQTVTVTGTGFLPGTTAAIDGVNVTTTVNNAQQLVLTTPTQVVGEYPVSVKVPGYAAVEVPTWLTVVEPTPAPVLQYQNPNTAAVVGSLAFPATPENTSSSAQAVNLVNVGNANLVFSTPALTVTGPYSMAGSSCTGTLRPGDVCFVSLTFNPKQAGPLNGRLTANSNVVAAPELILTGAGLATPTAASLAPTTVATTAGQTVVVTGSNFTAGTVASIDGTPVSTVVTDANTLTLTTPTLAAGAHTVRVTVPSHASITVPTPLNAIVMAPALEVRDNTTDAVLGSVAFGTVKAMQTSAPVTVKLRNGGNRDLVFGATPVTTTAPFKVTGTTCQANGTLTPGQSCTVTMTFAPTAAGTFNSNSYWTVSSNVSGNTLPALTGTATAAGVLSGKVTKLSGGNAKFAIGADSVTQYYASGKSVSILSPNSSRSVPVSVADNCSTKTAPNPSTLQFDDIAFDHSTGDVYVSGICRTATSNYDPIMVVRVNLTTGAGTIVYESSGGSNTAGQVPLKMSSNLTGQMAVSDWTAAVGIAGNQSGGSLGHSSSSHIVPVTNTAPAGAGWQRVVLLAHGYSGGTICSNAASINSCVTAPWNSNQRPAMALGLTGDMYVVNNGYLLQYKITYNANGSFKGLTIVAGVANDAGLAYTSTGKLVPAPDGSFYYYNPATGFWHIE